MRYYLKHFFDPDFDHTNRKPDADIKQNRGLDLFNLGYVQNVIKGQIIAQIVPIDTLDFEPNPRFILATMDFPAGQNTFVHPSYPQYLLAATNGYVFYDEGRITVRALLNVRQDVSFQTGNINFVGDMAVHGSVRAGFAILGSNVRIHGMIEGGIAHSCKNMIIDGGARGVANKQSMVNVGGKLLVNFLEKIEARSRGNIVVNKYCLYCTVYAGNNMLVKEQLYGGSINVFSSLYVGKQLGNKGAITTSIFLGYDPLSVRRLEKLEIFVTQISQSIMHLQAIVGHLPPDTNEKTMRLARLLEERKKAIEVSRALSQKISADQKTIRDCRLIVPGRVFPGVEINIGSYFFAVDKIYENVVFRLALDKIVVEPITTQESQGNQPAAPASTPKQAPKTSIA